MKNLIRILAVLVLLAVSMPVYWYASVEDAQAAYANGFWYRKYISWNGEAGAGTDYTITVKVGETSGATGEDFDLQGLAQDFPNDVIFTDNDGTTQLDHRLVALSGTTPNQLAIYAVQIDDDATNDFSFYCYFGRSYYTSTSTGDAFEEYGRLGAMNDVWRYGTNLVDDITEHSVIYDSQLYVTTGDLGTMDGGFKIFTMDGELVGSYASTVITYCAPVVWENAGEVYVFLYDMENGYLSKVRVSDDTIIATAKISSSGGNMPPDIEGMGWDTANNRLIIPSFENTAATEYYTSYRMTDLTVAWHIASDWGAHLNAQVPLIIGNYVYIKPSQVNSLYKLDLATGALVSYADLLGASTLSYASPIFDPNNQYIYCLGNASTVWAINPYSMSTIWSYTFSVGFTGMTTPTVHNTMGYHNNLVFVPIRDEAAGGTQYHAKLYALDALDGSVEWTDTTAWALGYDYITMLLTEEELVIPMHEVSIARGDDYLGEICVFRQSDGTLLARMAQPWQSMCGGVTQVINGDVLTNMARGYVAGLKLGWGSSTDSQHYNKNAYHNCYAGDLLEFDANLPFYQRNAVVPEGWTEDTAVGTISSEGLGMRISATENSYAHVQKAAPANANFAYEFRTMAEDENCGYAWGPSIIAYWDVDNWLQAGSSFYAVPGNALYIHAGYNDGGVYTDVFPATTISYNTWYWYRIRVDGSNVYFDYSIDYNTWTQFGTVARSANWAGAPSLIIVGKGRSFNPAYPNADFDNSAVPAGDSGVTWYQHVQARKYTTTEPSFKSAGPLQGTGPTQPSITTNAASDIGNTSAQLNAYVSDDGGEISSVRFSYYRSGGAWGDMATPWESGYTTGTSPSYPIYDLVTSATYYFRAEVKNTYGTVIGNTMSFIALEGQGNTTGDVPEVSTQPASNVASNSATLQGSLDDIPSGTTVYCYFEYGETTAYGSTTTEQSRTTVGSFNADISGLSIGTTYHFRAVCRYEVTEYTYGIDRSFVATAGGTTTSGLEVLTANVYRGYVENRDMLFVIGYTNTYATLYPNNEDVSKYFQLRLLDTDLSTVLHVVTCKQWGMRPGAIYLSADQAASLTEGSAYGVQIYGNFGINPSDTYVLQPEDWGPRDLQYLDRWCLTLAGKMQDNDGITYLTLTTGGDTMLNVNGGTRFIQGIPLIWEQRPNLFYYSTTDMTIPEADDVTTLFANDLGSDDMLGAQIEAAVDAVGTEFSITGEQVSSFAFWMIVLALLGVGYAASGGNTTFIGVMAIGLMFFGAYMRVIPIGVPVGIMGIAIIAYILHNIPQRT